MTRCAVAAPSQAATDAALDVAASGGNAVDAAIAAVMTATVTEFGITGPMGGAFVNVWEPGHEPVVIDANSEMPGRGREPERFGQQITRFDFDYFGPITVYGGPGTVGTPGLLAALDHAHARWGKAPWRESIGHAAHTAREGYEIGAAAAFWLGQAGDHLFGWHPETRAYLRQGPEGALPVAGQRMRSSDLAHSLDLIAREGAATVYTGELAHVIADDMDRNGALLGLEDLAAYRVVERPALRAQVGHWDVATNPPPSVGGPVLAAMLRVLEQRAEEHGFTSADLIETLRLVLGYRWAVVDVADNLEEAGHELIRLLDTEGPEGLTVVSNDPNTSPDTIHVSVTDAEGLACSITTSCGYCSGYLAPGTGLMFNNALGEAELNRKGFHTAAPGTRIASNMAPTTARTDTGTVLSLGSPGADRITTALLQVLSRLAFDGMSLADAVVHPRVHLSLEPTGLELRVEPHEEAEAAAVASGIPVNRSDGLTMYYGGVGAAGLFDGELTAVGDPRREAVTGISHA